MMRRITISVPDAINLDLVAKQTVLKIALHQSGFDSLSELERLGVAVLQAAIKSGMVKLPVKDKSKKRGKKG